MNQSRPVFISVKVIMAVIVAAMMALYILFPKLFFFETEHALDDPQLARSYLEATLAADPDNQAVIEKLAEVDVQLGEMQDAVRYIGRIKSPAHRRAVKQKMLFARWTANGAKHDDDFVALRRMLNSPSDWTSADYRHAQALGMHAQLAQYYAGKNQPDLAAEAWMMAGQPQNAMKAYQGHVSAKNLQPAITAALNSNHAETALKWWQQFGDGNVHKTLKLARLAGDREAVRRATEQLLQQYPDNSEYQRQVLKTRIAYGQLASAAQLLSKLERKYPGDPSLHQQGWQLATWLNRPEQAVSELIWLMQRDLATPAMIKTGAEHAKQLFLYDQELQIYRYLTRKKMITPKQLSDWMQAYEYSGHGQAELDDIAFYEKQYGPDKHSQYWKARTLYQSGDLDQLKQFWPVFRGEKTQEVLWWFARSFWLSHEFSQALAVYQYVPADADAQYWTTRVNLANLAGDKQDEAYAYEQLNQTDLLQGIQLARYLELKFSDAAKPNQKEMAFLWQHIASDSALERLAYFSWKLGDQAARQRVVKALAGRPPSWPLASAWVYLSYIYQQQGDFAQAKQALAHAQVNAPDSPVIEKEQGWLALASQDLPVVQDFLRHAARYPPGPFWSRLMASLAVYTENWRIAYHHLHWLIGQNPDALSLQVNYATVLEHVGRVDEAQHLRRQLLRRLPQDQNDYLNLISRWAGSARTFSLLKETRPAKAMASQFPELPQSVWWLKRHAATHLQSWEKLQLAMAGGEFGVIEDLIKNHQLSPLDEINSLTYIRQPYQAMEHWHQQEHLLSEQPRYELARNLRPYYFRALSLDVMPKAAFDSRERWMHIYFPFAKGEWQVGLGQQENDTNNGTLLTVRDDITWQRWRIGLGLNHHQGENESRTGFGLDISYQLTDRLQLGLDFKHDQQSSQNEFLFAQGQQSGYGVNALYQLDPRQNINLSVRHIDLTERNGQKIADGEVYDARYQYRLNQSYPDWQFYGSAMWQNLGARDAATNTGNNQVPDPGNGAGPVVSAATPAVDVDNFRRIALGTVLASGNGFTPPYTGSSSHWLVDMSTGYQPDSKHADFTISMQVGWEIIGDDSLNVGMGYQTRDIQGQENTRLQVGYYIHF
ncbi:hypothetical protein VA7868_03386 [Vibrio aerogenes CECT 7868]|uniref:PelB C-terminal domain-containing protein n=1 Tax=Vibrio aerogenes CECT 7868 TaxID=1216006 RepID=A0A1M5ZXI7_9VIBR|nr:tetratricopeptide repeat protein [Vibrio aerogenes]SHI28960.1 hypothetical protein VA7868_03386 [Vibrio aerogenes CECT 7868]